jgi:hemolysin III
MIWTLALGGILFKSVWRLRFPQLSTVLYLTMGWLAVIAVKPLSAVIPAAGLGLLLAGGLLYTGGVVFYAWERPRYAHMVWHLFVLGGSACHFLAILWYAIPASA